jgi:dynein heavy chain, axonemal
MERDNNLSTIKLTDSKFSNILMNGIRMGQSVLLENIDQTLDPFLEPVLQKQIHKKGGQIVLKLGDDEVPYSKDFKFFITTKLPNPHYLPEICIKVTIINFTVTPGGLEDQLLVEVVRYEKPELEEEKDKLIMMLAEFKKELKEIEDKILKNVAEASDDILNDEELINNLDQSKQTSTTINAKMKEAENTAKKINKTREMYRTVAIRGSILYFVIADLSLVDPMYQYSLEFFSKLFNLRLDKSQKAEDIETRLKILLLDITESFYVNICRGLFEKDKLLYSFLIACSLLRRK